jgi:hypothetical protein
MRTPNLSHQIAYIICTLFCVVILGNILLHMMFVGIRMLWFGAELFFLPLLIVASAYLVWHSLRFWKK